MVTTESMLADLADDIATKKRELRSDQQARNTLIRLLHQQGRSLRYIARAAGFKSENSVRKILLKGPE